MKELKDILHGIPVRHVVGNLNVSVTDLCFDSRKATIDSLFVAVVGTQVDGHDYVDNAVALGASVVICEHVPETTDDDVTYIQVEDTAYALGVSASNFFGNPSTRLKLVGVDRKSTRLNSSHVKISYAV